VRRVWMLLRKIFTSNNRVVVVVVLLLLVVDFQLVKYLLCYRK